MQQLERFEATRPLRKVTDELATALFYTDTPLTAQQADQLVEIMANNVDTTRGSIDVATMNSEAVLGQAQAALAPAQLEALRRLDTKLRNQREADRRLNESRKSGSPRPPGS